MTVPAALETEVAELLDARIGQKTDASFRPRLTRALRDLAHARTIDEVQLVAALAHDPALLDDLVERVTVQETGFFRHPDQFESLARTVLPSIRATSLRAWSAASSNGQEAYSLAMVFEEAGRPGTVLASDVSPAALRRTNDGYYAANEMRGVSATRRHRHFTPSGAGWQATPALRAAVVTQRHNLIDAIPRHVARCHIVMCRNVLIYFSAAHARAFLGRLADAMPPGALLFVGGTETLWQMTDRFEPLHLDGCYAYRPTSTRAPVRSGVAAVRTAPRRDVPRPPVTVTPPPVVAAAPAAAPLDVAPAGDPQQLGRRLLAEGAVAEAIVAFRQWTYQRPDDPLAHFQMGVTLERLGDGATARRSYRAALAALDRADPADVVQLLEGYSETELRDLLTTRSGAGAARRAAAPARPSPPARWR